MLEVNDFSVFAFDASLKNISTLALMDSVDESLPIQNLSSKEVLQSTKSSTPKNGNSTQGREPCQFSRAWHDLGTVRCRPILARYGK